MMKIEFLYSELIEFLKMHSLFKGSIDERIQLLIEAGEIEEDLPSEAIKQKYNDVILNNVNYSKLLKNSFFEKIIKDITGNEISIIGRDDYLISGIHCPACNYIVFENKEDSFYEICPVCMWQNDGSVGDDYSSCNHSTMNEYTKKDSFKLKLITGNEKYMKFCNK
ncbi:CPCC family cysteine-rich protein [Xenorhabdus sp. KJ12.1]|uniref:CPCC family cysteine-rich protein n=1 Tax=Xenorhabdus sp. KJ12.1 TaxID=1851571 RepID=UPI000C06284A|nr:CPCC family cysteine-rich protein [Xenorhabdus sp. KJ12.1]PHM66253.1 hydrolase [Xenorhabdus sp. KJ12.1]